MMEVTLTCSECGSGIHVHPDLAATSAKCSVCSNEMTVKFNEDHIAGNLIDCPCCERKDFYSQKDFNRKIGVTLFVIASILSIWTYGISFIVLYALDFFLFRKLSMVAVCYKCNTLFRVLNNMADIHPYNHEMNDRIVYKDHDFGGVQLEHH